MASFPSPSAQPKMHVGKANRPKRTDEHTDLDRHIPREYPITDEFASHEIPGYHARRAKYNPKTGFNAMPAKSDSTRCTQPPPYGPCRGYGREVGRDEDESSADTATANNTKLVKKQGKNPGLGAALKSAQAGAMAGIQVSGGSKGPERNPILTQKQSPGY